MVTHEAAQKAGVSHAGELVLERDPDRFLAARYAGSGRRDALIALFALDVSFGQVVSSTTEPLLGQVRLAWWRESLEKLDTAPPPAEPVLTALADAVLPTGVTGAALSRLEDGWLALLEEPLDEDAIRRHGEERGGALFALAAAILGEQAQGSDEGAAIERLGMLWGWVDLAAGLRDGAARATALRLAASVADAPAMLSRPLRPLGALAMLARRDLARGIEQRRPGAPMRQLRMLAYVLSGR